MKKKDEKTYAIELNAQDFADVFTGIWIDYMSRAVNDLNTKRLLKNSVKLLVVYMLETGKATGTDFGKLGVEMIDLANNPDKVQAGNPSSKERYQELMKVIEALAEEQEKGEAK